MYRHIIFQVGVWGTVAGIILLTCAIPLIIYTEQRLSLALVPLVLGLALSLYSFRRLGLPSTVPVERTGPVAFFWVIFTLAVSGAVYFMQK